MPDPQDAPYDVRGALVENVELVHGRPTCDEAGRPLNVYMCDYHQGYQEGLEIGERWAAYARQKAEGDDRG